MALAACSTVHSHSMHVPPAQFRSAISRPGTSRHASQGTEKSAAGLVEKSLHARGIRFGTDGTSLALYAFVSGRFEQIPADQARAGDVVFFDLGSGCGGHAGLVEVADADGRLGFREWRDGSTRHSYVTPRAPVLRRDDAGRIMNTFLRPKRIDDPPTAAYFAGEMLCGVFHVETPLATSRVMTDSSTHDHDPA